MLVIIISYNPRHSKNTNEMCFLAFRCKITTIKLYEQTILHRCGLEVVCFITYFS